MMNDGAGGGTKRSWHETNVDAGLRTKIDDNASSSSRQKSCNACVRGKRRCDKRTPRCYRCAAKGLDCVYQKLPPGAAAAAAAAAPAASDRVADNVASSLSSSSSSSHSSPSSSPSILSARRGPPSSSASASRPDLAHSSYSTASAMPDFDMGFDFDSSRTGTDTSPESFGTDMGDHGLGFSIADLMTAPGDPDFWNLHTFGTGEASSDKLAMPPLPSIGFNNNNNVAAALKMTMSTTTTTSPPPAPTAMAVADQQMLPRTRPQPQTQTQTPTQPRPQPQPLRDVSIIRDCAATCLEADPLAVHDPQTRVGYTVSYMTKMHETFAQTRALPFLHPRLWAGQQLPGPILTVFAAAAAYAARTPSTKAWTMRLLTDAGREIHRQGESAIGHADKLARVQALIILNSIRIFDGDVALRAAAERENVTFLAWVEELNQVRHQLQTQEDLVVGRDNPPRTWESWIFLESLRRTVLLSYAITCLACMLKSEMPNDDMWKDDNDFTASKHLWDASSSVDFFRAWRDKPKFPIHDMGFKEFWMYALPEDCDEFTRLMLTTHVGVDAMEHFMNGDTIIPIDASRIH